MGELHFLYRTVFLRFLCLLRLNKPENSEQCESVGISNIPAHIVDLTMGENDDNESTKSLSCNLQGFSAAGTIWPSGVNYMAEQIKVHLPLRAMCSQQRSCHLLGILGGKICFLHR